MSLSIDIAIEHDAWRDLPDLDASVERAVGAALAVAAQAEAAQAEAAPAADAELSLVLCDDAFIRDLNARWRDKDAATNVLSFPSADPAMLGDIIVAYETCAREARDEGRSLADHLAHMIVHGVFHLLGFDHLDDDEAEEMERLEAQALASLGIASPYAVEATP